MWVRPLKFPLSNHLFDIPWHIFLFPCVICPILKNKTVPSSFPIPVITIPIFCTLPLTTFVDCCVFSYTYILILFYWFKMWNIFPGGEHLSCKFCIFGRLLYPIFGNVILWKFGPIIWVWLCIDGSIYSILWIFCLLFAAVYFYWWDLVVTIKIMRGYFIHVGCWYPLQWYMCWFYWYCGKGGLGPSPLQLCMSTF